MAADPLALYEDLRSEEPHRIERAIRQLTQRVKKMAIRLVMSNSGTHADIDDLVQDVVVIVWQQVQLGQYQPRNNVPLEAYVYGVLRRNWLKTLRQRRQQGMLDDISEHMPAESASEETSFEQLEWAFRQLESTCQQVLRWCYWDGVTMADIANQLNTTVTAAKQRKYRCMLALGKLLGNKQMTNDQ